MLGAAAVVAVAVIASVLWVARSPQPASAGTPRLEVDRTEIDLGYMRFDTTARVLFTLTNAGTGPLRVTEAPRVKLVAGC